MLTHSSALQALMKIIKHSRESHTVVAAPPNTSNATVTFTPAVGQLFGIDSNGTLEVSNAFGLPAGTLGGSLGETDGESKGAKAGSSFSFLFSPYFPSHRCHVQVPSTPPRSSTVSRTSTWTLPSSVSTPRPTTARSSLPVGSSRRSSVLSFREEESDRDTRRRRFRVLDLARSRRLSLRRVQATRADLVSLSFTVRFHPPGLSKQFRADSFLLRRYLERCSGCRRPQGLPPFCLVRRGLPRWQV